MNRTPMISGSRRSSPRPFGSPSARAWYTVATVLVQVALAAPLAGQDAPPLDVAGVVIDVATRDGIEDVILRIRGTEISAATDEDGRFLLQAVPPGSWTLEVDHIRYGSHEHEITLEPGIRAQIQIRMTEEAIELEPIVVEGRSEIERQRRAQGSSFWRVDRSQIEEALGMSRHLGDLIQRTVPGIRVRQASNLSDSDVCLEFRAAASISIVNARPCNHPAVYMDGVPIGNPQYLYGSVGLDNIESIQMIPPGEAGARYGSGSLYGVLLIETRRPGADRARDGLEDALGARRSRRPVSFDWSLDPEGHDTGRTLLGAAVGNALGLAAGIALARQCVDIVDETIETTCSLGTTVGAGTAAFALPAFGSVLGARWGGGTEVSVGKLVPSLLGAGLMLFPGYSFSLSTVGGDVAAVNTIGYAFLAIGVPIVVTLTDRAFRKLR